MLVLALGEAPNIQKGSYRLKSAGIICNGPSGPDQEPLLPRSRVRTLGSDLGPPGGKLPPSVDTR